MQVDLTRDEILLLISCTTYAVEQWARYQIEGAAAPCLKRFDNLTEKLQKVVNSSQVAANNPVDAPPPSPLHKDFDS